ALRRASIGVSMGMRGTEVARAASDLVLLRDDFAALVDTVREGRRIFDNLVRAFLYLIAFHIPIFGLALFVPLLGLPLLLLPVHLVWLELIVHPVSALLFEAEPAAPDVMQRPPRNPKLPLLPMPLVWRSVLSGIALTAAALALYHFHLPAGEPHARASALAVLICGSLLLVFAERASSARWTEVPFPRSLRFWLIWGAAAATLPAALYLAPVAQALRVESLGARDWFLVLGAAAASVGWRSFGSGRKARAPSLAWP
ncbi:MAG TPA: cation-translocating P-type ATPase, partial [Myxococcales bacterium]|nr:cation-translocating P-type ATPase [Myxococcales bacterium]